MSAARTVGPRPARRRGRAIAAGVVLALVAFELALQIGSYVLWLRGGRETAADGDRRVVLCVGDSFTYGLGASDPSTSYPAALQRALDELRAGAFHVVNGGRPGQSSADVLRRLPQQLASWRPWGLVVLVGYNDHWKRPALVAAEELRAEPETFPLRLRTLALLGRVVDALGARAPVTDPHELLGAWSAPGLDMRFDPDGVCVAYGITVPYTVDGPVLRIGDTEPVTWQRSGSRLVLRGAALPGGRVELERADDRAVTPGSIGRLLLEQAESGGATLGADAVVAACARLAERPGESRLWWQVAAAAARGVEPDRVLATIATAAARLARDDPWRAGLYRIKAGILVTRDADAALAAVLEATLADGDDGTLASWLETLAPDDPSARIAAATAILAPAPDDRARLDAMLARIAGARTTVPDVLAAHLRTVAELARAQGVRVWLATYPEPEPGVTGAIRSAAADSDTPVIEVGAAFAAAQAAEPERSLFVFDRHCNDAGYALLARTVAAAVLASDPPRGN